MTLTVELRTSKPSCGSTQKSQRVSRSRSPARKEKGDDDDAALADFERAVELAPQAPETHSLLGLFQYKLSKWDDALAHCRTALQLRPIPTAISSQNACIGSFAPPDREQETANEELQTWLKSLDDTKTNEWSAITSRFLTGSLSEPDFLNLATSAAKRPSAKSAKDANPFTTPP